MNLCNHLTMTQRKKFKALKDFGVASLKECSNTIDAISTMEFTFTNTNANRIENLFQTRSRGSAGENIRVGRGVMHGLRNDNCQGNLHIVVKIIRGWYTMACLLSGTLSLKKAGNATTLTI